MNNFRNEYIKKQTNIDSWIEYLHPKLMYPVVAMLEEEEKIKEKGLKIIKKVVNSEIVTIEAE